MADPGEDVMLDEFHLPHVGFVLLLQSFQLFIQPRFLLLQVALLQFQLADAQAVLVELNCELFVVLLQLGNSLLRRLLPLLRIPKVVLEGVHFLGEALLVLLQHHYLCVHAAQLLFVSAVCWSVG